MPFRSLLRRAGRFHGLVTRGASLTVAPAIAPIAVSTIAAIAAIATITVTKSPATFVAVAIGLAQHCRWTFFKFIDPYGQVAQHVLAQAFLALDLIDCGRWRIEVKQSEVGFAIFAQAIGQGSDAPLFGLDDFPAQLLDDAFELGRQLFDLLRTDILASQEDVLVEGHEDAFPIVVPSRR
jgi:hypothetical protein